ncbi:MAG: hypothetical protein MI919_11125, partial [Holophagales bacterium]|nr:hypothetical protein [Holophagales bacterium]
PRGALLVAAQLFRTLRRMGLLPESPATGPDGRAFDLEADLERRLEELEGLEQDPLEVEEWLGLGFDLSNLANRDLWKHDHVLRELDRRLAEDPSDVRALVYRGNGLYFRVDGAARAARDYRAALEAAGGDLPAVAANLEKLLAEREP